jgi:hypothetical protein
MNDKDVEALLNNLKSDTKAFRSNFNSAVGKSSIRKTSQEKDAKTLVQNFQIQTETLLSAFTKNKTSDQVQAMVTNAEQIDKLVTTLNMNSKTSASWQKVRDEVTQVAGALNITPAWMTGAGATTTGTATDGGVTCLQAVGAERSKTLVEECMQVSPATHSL